MPTKKADKTTSDVAKEVLAYCTSCKMDLAHTVVSMKGDKLGKVECKTCKKTHVFKAPKGITDPPKEKKPRKAKEKANLVAEEWEKLMDTHKDIMPKNYSMKTDFAIGDKINHPTFGTGLVNRLIYPNKIEVIFKEDLKVLIYSGKQA